jgi:phosphoglucosamine mutase
VAGFERFPQVLVSVPVAEKRPIEELPGFMQTLERVERELDGRGRILVRYSGTEAKARVMVEGEDERRVAELADELAGELRRALGGN